MRIPKSIDRILELGEAIYRHDFWARNSKPEKNGKKAAPPPELKELERYLKSLPFSTLYFVITAIEVGRELVHPLMFLTTYVAAAGAFPLHYQAIERVLKDPTHLALYLERGLRYLHEARIDANRLLEPWRVQAAAEAA